MFSCISTAFSNICSVSFFLGSGVASLTERMVGIEQASIFRYHKCDLISLLEIIQCFAVGNRGYLRFNRSAPAADFLANPSIGSANIPSSRLTDGAKISFQFFLIKHSEFTFLDCSTRSR